MPSDSIPSASPRFAQLCSSLATGVCAVSLAAALLSTARGAGASTILSFVATCVVLALALRLGKQIDSKLGYGFFIAYIAVVLVWTLMVSSQQISDFGVYLRCGSDFWTDSKSFRDWTHTCQSVTLPGNITYWRRSLLYTLPLGLTGMGSYTALKSLNLVLHVATVAALFYVTKRWMGRSESFAASVALVLYPEFWFTTTLAASDNLALLLLIVWLHILARCIEGQARIDELLLFPLLVGALDLLRDIGIICVLATAFLMLCTSPRRLRLLALCVLSFCLITLIGKVAIHLSAPPVQESGLLVRVVGNGVTTMHSWTDAYRWIQYVYPLVPQHLQARYSAGLLAIDLQNGLLPALHNWIFKLRELFGGGGYFFFSSAPIDTNPNSLRIGDGVAHPAMPWLSPFLRGISAAFLLGALVGLTRRRLSGIGKAGVAFAAAFLVLVIAFGEVQPRYAVLLGPSVAILIGGIHKPVSESRVRWASRNVLTAAGFLVVLCASMFGVAALADRYLSNDASMSSFRQEKKETVDGKICNVEPAAVDVRETYIRIEMPVAGPACYSFMMSLTGPVHQLRYYVTRDPVPPLWTPPAAFPVTVRTAGPDVEGAVIGNPLGLGDRVAQTSHIERVDSLNDTTIRFLVDVGAVNRAPLAIAIGFLHDDAGNPVRLPLRKRAAWN